MTLRPVLTTLAAFAVVFGFQTLVGFVGIGTVAFALALPLGHQPWTLLTSVYAHSTLGHLIANTLALAIIGPFVAYLTSPVRFHAFFVTTGVLAGVAQVVLTVPLGGSAVIGASGAIFALLGYLVVGNRASEVAISWLPLGRRGRLALFAALAALVTITTAAPGVALVAHFAGFLFGAIAGQARLLHTRRTGH